VDHIIYKKSSMPLIVTADTKLGERLDSILEGIKITTDHQQILNKYAKKDFLHIEAVGEKSVAFHSCERDCAKLVNLVEQKTGSKTRLLGAYSIEEEGYVVGYNVKEFFSGAELFSVKYGAPKVSSDTFPPFFSGKSNPLLWVENTAFSMDGKLPVKCPPDHISFRCAPTELPDGRHVGIVSQKMVDIITGEKICELPPYDRIYCLSTYAAGKLYVTGDGSRNDYQRFCVFTISSGKDECYDVKERIFKEDREVHTLLTLNDTPYGIGHCGGAFDLSDNNLLEGNEDNVKGCKNQYGRKRNFSFHFPELPGQLLAIVSNQKLVRKLVRIGEKIKEEARDELVNVIEVMESLREKPEILKAFALSLPWVQPLEMQQRKDFYNLFARY